MRISQLAGLLLGFAVTLAASGRTSNPAVNGADLFEKGMNALEGSAATRSVANALGYFQRAADLGYAPAQVVLGYLYETGLNTSADPQQAIDFYKKAAQQDDPLAQWMIGRLTILGIPTRDLNSAAGWLEKSRGHDNPFAAYLLGRVFLERGDYARAASLFQEASLQGLPQAQKHLATLLRNGQGVQMDKSEAYVWMLISNNSGLRTSAEELQALESDLSSSQLEQAKIKARDLGAKTARSVVGHGCTGWPGEFDEVPAPPPPDLQRFCR